MDCLEGEVTRSRRKGIKLMVRLLCFMMIDHSSCYSCKVYRICPSQRINTLSLSLD